MKKQDLVYALLLVLFFVSLCVTCVYAVDWAVNTGANVGDSLFEGKNQ